MIAGPAIGIGEGRSHRLEHGGPVDRHEREEGGGRVEVELGGGRSLVGVGRRDDLGDGHTGYSPFRDGCYPKE